MKVEKKGGFSADKMLLNCAFALPGAGLHFGGGGKDRQMPFV